MPDDLRVIVNEEEVLARFILFEKHIKEGRISADAFMPPRTLELSVTRHVNLSEQEIWNHGHNVANQRSKPLFGRGDINAKCCISNSLKVKSDPLDDNPSHAVITEWPTEKAAQRTIAKLLAANAMLVNYAD